MSTLEFSQLLGNYGEFIGAIAIVAARRRLVPMPVTWVVATRQRSPLVASLCGVGARAKHSRYR